MTQQSPIIRTAAPVMDISEKTCSLEIDFSLELLNRAVDSASKPRQGGWRCLKKLDQGGWLCSDGNEIMAVNFTRLFEVILFSRLANEYVLPSQPVTNPLNIDARYYSGSAALVPIHLMKHALSLGHLRPKKSGTSSQHYPRSMKHQQRHSSWILASFPMD